MTKKISDNIKPLQVTFSQKGTKTTSETHIRKFEMLEELLFSHQNDGVYFSWQKELNH